MRWAFLRRVAKIFDKDWVHFESSGDFGQIFDFGFSYGMVWTWLAKKVLPETPGSFKSYTAKGVVSVSNGMVSVIKNN